MVSEDQAGPTFPRLPLCQVRGLARRRHCAGAHGSPVSTVQILPSWVRLLHAENQPVNIPEGEP